MGRTIVDILKKGNQELFHSSLIAWLLNPKGEHELGETFINHFTEKLEKKGYPELKNILKNSSKILVLTETKHTGGRYDIEIVADDSNILIENKTKTIGSSSQLDDYKAAFKIALGFCEVSYTEDVIAKYPFITYSDILDILEKISLSKKNDFSVLIDHYRRFLSRELQILDLIRDCYANGNIVKHTEIKDLLEAGYYTENDYRFLNLYLLEKFFLAHIKNNPNWQNSEWDINKNMQSGVWLANWKQMPSKFTFLPEIENLRKQGSGKLWFHIELHQGVKTENVNGMAGVLQLRGAVADKREFISEFKKIFKCNDDERFAYSIKGDTFIVVVRDLLNRELVFDELASILVSFAGRFGNFMS